MNDDEIQSLILRLLDEALEEAAKKPRRPRIGRPRRYASDRDRWRAYRLRRRARLVAQEMLQDWPTAPLKLQRRAARAVQKASKRAAKAKRQNSSNAPGASNV